MARGYRRHPYSTYSGYGKPTYTSGPTPQSSVPDDYPQKIKEHTPAQHLEVLQKWHDDKRAEHGDMWRAPDHYHKDVALNQAMAQIERAFGTRK